jgi:hypothetical protein
LIEERVHFSLHEVNQREETRLHVTVFVVDHEEDTESGKEEEARNEDGFPKRRDGVAEGIRNAVRAKGLVLSAAGNASSACSLLTDLHSIINNRRVQSKQPKQNT